MRLNCIDRSAIKEEEKGWVFLGLLCYTLYTIKSSILYIYMVNGIYAFHSTEKMDDFSTPNLLFRFLLFLVAYYIILYSHLIDTNSSFCGRAANAKYYSQRYSHLQIHVLYILFEHIRLYICNIQKAILSILQRKRNNGNDCATGVNMGKSQHFPSVYIRHIQAYIVFYYVKT